MAHVPTYVRTFVFVPEMDLLLTCILLSSSIRIYIRRIKGSPSWINHSKLSSLFQQFRCFCMSAFLLLTAESLVFEGPSAGKGPCLCQRALAISSCTLSQQGPVTNLGCITNA